MHVMLILAYTEDKTIKARRIDYTGLGEGNLAVMRGKWLIETSIKGKPT